MMPNSWRRRSRSSSSKDYGKPFSEIFKEVAYDFYRIDPMLFAPATIAITSLVSGKTFRAGRFKP